MENYYQPEVELASREEMRKIQDEKIVKQVKYVWDHVPYYRKKMEDQGVTPEDVKSIDDLQKLPFLSKADLREAYPYGLVGAPLEECVRIQSTSGTTGKRVVAFYTQADIDLWEECCARALTAAGATNKDVCQVSYGYGLFTGGPGLNGGSHKVGCLTIPTSSGNTERQIMFIRDLNATILCCTPSYAAYLAETMQEMGLTPDEIPLKAGIFGAEAWSEEMRRDIEQKLGIKAYDIYGLTELSGPGVSFECSEQSGMHINEDHFYPEIIDPETGRVLPEGTQGELVFTSLDKKGFPLLRYRTRDVCVLSRGKCSCGRTLIKMAKPRGRTDDMLIIRGVNVFPSQIETVLLNHGYPANYQIIVDRVNNSDTFDVRVEMTPEMFTDNVGEVSRRQKELVDGLKSMLGIKAKVTLVAPKSITRSEGKAVRVIDKRKIQEEIMSIKQLSVFVENRPGAMNELTQVLADNNINMRALSLAETEGFGIVRIIVDDILETTTVLKQEGYINQLNPVVVVEIPHVAGGLNDVLTIFTKENININYMYAILSTDKALMTFKVDDPKVAEAALRRNGIHILTQDEIADL